jgi:hypothetical protein
LIKGVTREMGAGLRWNPWGRTCPTTRLEIYSKSGCFLVTLKLGTFANAKRAGSTSRNGGLRCVGILLSSLAGDWVLSIAA